MRFVDRVVGASAAILAPPAKSFLKYSWLLLISMGVHAADVSTRAPEWKLTVGDYFYQDYSGICRTNLKPYFNLNFDPNDAITIGAGHHADNGAIYSVFVVADDRLHTQQRDWHLSARLPLGSRRAVLEPVHASCRAQLAALRSPLPTR